jgi:hypothetical protein
MSHGSSLFATYRSRYGSMLFMNDDPDPSNKKYRHFFQFEMGVPYTLFNDRSDLYRKPLVT